MIKNSIAYHIYRYNNKNFKRNSILLFLFFSVSVFTHGVYAILCGGLK